MEAGLTPLLYVDDGGRPTQRYPMNPNGSPGGVAAILSPCGRHLAVMPHPERGVLRWQWGYWPHKWGGRWGAAPWLKMFLNAREWCEGQP
uniref:Phosphoribosylformylglycinamidine synthase n=1 Tax=Coturnix japonica TaxID=93934 RepID=A0A8C2SQF2_COTJA